MKKHITLISAIITATVVVICGLLVFEYVFPEKQESPEEEIIVQVVVDDSTYITITAVQNQAFLTYFALFLLFLRHLQ